MAKPSSPSLGAPLILRLLTFFALLGPLGACDISRMNANRIDRAISDVDFDLHEVEYSAVPKRYNVASYSHINRGNDNRASDLNDVRLITGGSDGDWVWSVYADSQAHDFAASFAGPRLATVGDAAGPRAVTIPSWNGAITHFSRMASAVFGAAKLPLEIRITVVGEPVNFEKFVVHDDDHHIVLDYYFAAGNLAGMSPASSFQWLADTVATIGHEYSHAYIDASDTQLPNAITDEVMAYTFEQCVKLTVVGRQAGISYLDKGGRSIDPSKLEFATLLKTQGSASLNAYYLAEYDTVHVLGTSSIDKDDLRTKDRLLGLCAAEYHHINDFEKSFYPAANVQAIDFSWGSGLP